MRRLVARFAITAIITVSFISCAATGPYFTPTEQAPEMSLIYIFRAVNIAGSLLADHIYVDGSKLVELYNGGYAFTTVPPGEHVIASRKLRQLFLPKKEIAIRLLAEPGKTYYVRVGTALTSFTPLYMEFTRRIQLMDEQTGLPELSTMRLQQQ